MQAEDQAAVETVLDLYLNDFEWFCRECLKIQERDTLQPVPLVWKPAQRRLAELMCQALIDGEPIRIIILKARRHGMSTIVQAFFFWRCATRRWQHSMTIAHDQKTTNYLHGMTERFYRYMPPGLRPMKAGSTRGTFLEFKNPSKNEYELDTNPGQESSMQTTSLENAGAGMGLQWVHLSEVGRWNSQAGEEALTTILQTVPLSPNTAVVIESTAQGAGNSFHEMWNEAQTYDSRYTAFFAPWCEHPDFEMPPEEGFQPTPDELELRAYAESAYGIDLTDAKLQWRRSAIKNECRGKLKVFHQEYPFTPEEAFLTSGRPFFDLEAVNYHAERAKDTPVIHRGELFEQVEDTPDGQQRVATFEPNAYGPLRIWEEPAEGEEYIIFSDCAAGESEKGDYQCATVIRRSRDEEDRFVVCAVWHGKIDRDQFAEQLSRLGYLYNKALIAVEITGGWGASVVTSLRRERYPQIYRRRRDRTKRDQSRQQLYGWETTPATRAAMLDALEEVIRDDEILCGFETLWQECRTFVYVVPKKENPGVGKAQAASGTHDDTILSCAGAIYLAIYEPKRRRKRPGENTYQPLSSVAGY